MNLEAPLPTYELAARHLMAFDESLSLRYAIQSSSRTISLSKQCIKFAHDWTDAILHVTSKMAE